MNAQITNFIVAFGANLIAGVIVAFTVYWLIDMRLKKQQEKRSYQSLYLVVLRVIAKLDYLVDWLEKLNNGNAERDFIPYNFKSDPSIFINRLRDQLVMSPDVDIEVFVNVEDGLIQAEDMLNKVYELWKVAQGRSMYDVMRMDSRMFPKWQIMVENIRDQLLESFVKIQEVSNPYSSDDWLRKRMVNTLKRQDDLATFEDADKSNNDNVTYDDYRRSSSGRSSRPDL